MNRRAVLYARVSKDDRKNDALNLQGQIEMGREYCHEHGYNAVAELKEDDRGASGADFDLPEINRALEMARAGEFDVLVVRELDRFARRLAKQLVVESEFQRAGVAVEYILEAYDDTPEGQLQKNVRAVIAEYERGKIAQRTVRGRRRKVKAGIPIVHGRSPYGYRLVDVDGKPTLMIYEPEARIVRMIFNWYVQGDSIRGVTVKLNEMGIPTPKLKKRKWGMSTVRVILNNETYIGVWRYGKWRYDENGKRLRNPESHILTIEVEPLIDRQTWQAVSGRLQGNKRKGGKPKYSYLLRGRVICAECSTNMVAKTTVAKSGAYSYYFCPVAQGHGNVSHYQDRQCNHVKHYRADHADAVVWEHIQEYLEKPGKRRAAAKKRKAQREKELEPLRERLRVIESLIDDSRAQLERALDLYLSGDFPREMLTERKGRLETTVDSLERERDTLSARLEQHTITDEQIQSFERFMAKAAEGVKRAAGDFEAKRHVLEMMDAEVILELVKGVQYAHFHAIVADRSLLVESISSGTCVSGTLPT